MGEWRPLQRSRDWPSVNPRRQESDTYPLLVEPRELSELKVRNRLFLPLLPIANTTAEPVEGEAWYDTNLDGPLFRGAWGQNVTMWGMAAIPGFNHHNCTGTVPAIAGALTTSLNLSGSTSIEEPMGTHRALDCSAADPRSELRKC